MNRLGQDRSQSHGQNRIGQNNRIDRTEHNPTDRMHHGTHTQYHDNTKSPSRGGADHGTKRGRARTPCRLARRGDVHEHHVVDDPAREKKPKEGDGSKRIVAGQRHLLSIYTAMNETQKHQNATCRVGITSRSLPCRIRRALQLRPVSSCFIILKVRRVRHDMDCTLCRL